MGLAVERRGERAPGGQQDTVAHELEGAVGWDEGHHTLAVEAVVPTGGRAAGGESVSERERERERNG